MRCARRQGVRVSATARPLNEAALSTRLPPQGDVHADRVKELAALLEVTPAHLYAEAEHLPGSLGELSAEALYNNMRAQAQVGGSLRKRIQPGGAASWPTCPLQP